MTEIKKSDKVLDWICRILFSVGILLLISGYLSALQTRAQLLSPLIPPGTTEKIISDTRLFESSIGSGLFLLAGCWLYSFGKKKETIVLLGAAILAHQLIPFFI